MLYKKTFKLTFSAIVLFSFVRIFLKVLDIDVTTGFYSNGNIWGFVFNVAIFASVALISAITLFAKDKESFSIRQNLFGQGFYILSGGVIAFSGGLSLLHAIAMPKGEIVVNAMPKWANMLEGCLGIGAGIAMVVMAIFVFSGAQVPAGVIIASVVPAVWQAVAMIGRYMEFRYTSTASDQLFATLHMVFATMFFLSFSRCIASIKASRKLCIFYAVNTAIFGIVVAVGQIAAVSVLKTQVLGPDILKCAIMIVVSIYALVFANSISYSDSK